MTQVQLTDEQKAVLARNLSKDKRIISAQRKEAKRIRDEERAKARTQKAAEMVAAMSEPQDLILAIAAVCIDKFPIKIGKTWIR